MSAFNRFCAATKRTVKKITNKTEEVFDSVANSIKIKNLEMKIDELYEDLGRIIYRDLHTEENLEEEKLQVIAAIDALFDRISELKAAAAPAAEETAEEAAEEVAEVVTEEAAAPAEGVAEPTDTENTDSES